jgi:hypothetical protein
VPLLAAVPQWVHDLGEYVKVFLAAAGLVAATWALIIKSISRIVRAYQRSIEELVGESLEQQLTTDQLRPVIREEIERAIDSRFARLEQGQPPPPPPPPTWKDQP